ncbi:MAG: sulfurtransferase [Burkholderiaceae bacterium]
MHDRRVETRDRRAETRDQRAEMRDRRAEMLVDPRWLAANLAAPQLRILDCTTYMIAQPVGASLIRSGRPDYDEAHIPGAQHVDMVDDLSAPAAPFPYTMPPPAQIEALLGRLGIGNEHHIVVYGRGHIPTVTRVWYVLHAMGHRKLSILDGGFERWQREGLPATREVPRFAPVDYRTSFDPRRVADLNEVRAALSDTDVLLLNALGRDQFAGSGGAHYGRPGRIPGSVNVPARELADQETKVFHSTERIRALFDATNALSAPRVLAYCGGGIAASAAAFALEMLGHPDWAVYDNSLLEWSAEAGLPMLVG